ncbi:hypothetical protein THYS13_24110 [Thermoanaerobacter sp. YS13]|uniref:DUF896 domain-containing protein n=1 Tax=Thermoanaerobacter sp. YS13 TaxID=1511746 RepID=UPI0005732D13|nr:DUF896 domain-containing protein [Thermoanaerobacter sp. YS13]KHO61938.1 hypothetical protein THYS13_24110 [Thermoanaerobacter sp. YS13]
MITREMIDRINFLYYKSQTEGLTEEEKEEQKRLRQEYVKEIKERVRRELESIKYAENGCKHCGHDHHHHRH